MTYQEYRTLRTAGQISAGIDNSTALRLIDRLPRQYQYAHTFWSWVWMLSIPGFIILAFFTFGIGILGLIFVTPMIFRATKKSAAQFVLQHAEDDEAFFNLLVARNLLTFATTETRQAMSDTRQKAEKTAPDISGEWEIEEEYARGTTSVVAEIFQTGNSVRGVFIITDRTNAGEEFIIKESVSGMIRAGLVRFEGKSYQLVKGTIQGYSLDTWDGRITDEGTIEGTSVDADSVSGNFTMRRRTVEHSP